MLATVDVVDREAAELRLSGLEAGRNVFSAAYLGTPVHLPSRTPWQAHQVLPPERAETTTVLSANPSPSLEGEAVRLRAEVTSASGVPDGPVRFRLVTDDGPVVLAEVPTAGGVAEFETATLEAGWHVLTALFARTDTHEASSSTRLRHQVLPPGRADTTTVLSAHPSPSHEGEAVRLRAEVTSASGVPDGLVRFRLVTDDGPVVLAEVPTAGGVAEFETAALEAGWHVLTALFARTDTHEASSSTRLRHQVLPEPDRALLHTGRAGDPPAR